MSRKRVQKDRALPLKRAITETVYRRKDSSLWQARFAAPDGTLVRLSTGTRNRGAALECLVLMKKHVALNGYVAVSITPPPERVLRRRISRPF